MSSQGARSSESPLLLGVVEGEFRAQTGDFAKSWVQTVDEKELTLVDVAKGVSQCVTHRIREEQTKGTLAGALCSALIRKVFVKSFERAIENEEQPNHSTLEKTLSDACEKLPAAVLKSFSKIKVLCCVVFSLIKGGFLVFVVVVSHDDVSVWWWCCEREVGNVLGAFVHREKLPM